MSTETHPPWELRELGPEWAEAWDTLAGNAPESGFMQSSTWARFKRSEGYHTLHLGLFRDDRLRGGAQLYYYPSGGEEGFFLCPEGPVVPWNDTEAAREGLRCLVGAVRSRAAAHGGIGLRIEPHLSSPAPSMLRNWTRSPVDLTPVHTLFLDLTLPDEELLARMHPKGRYNLRISQRHGVRIRCPAGADEQAAELSRFYALFVETALRGGFFAEPYGFFLNLGATLFPENRARLFLAEWEGELLASVLVVFFGRRATYLYGGSSAENRRVMPNYALHWAALQEARRRGCREYDLFGYDPFGLPDHLYAGISRFKKQLGGDRVDSIGARDYFFYDRLADRMVQRLRHEAGAPG